MLLLNRTSTTLSAFALFLALILPGTGAVPFSLAVGSRGLMVSQLDGQAVLEISAPSINRKVDVGGESFRVSYGRDAGGQLCATLMSATSGPVDLHFKVLGKAVDVAQAIVSLTFSENMQSVTIDPGFLGTVDVDAHRLLAHQFAEDSLAPRSDALPETAVTTVPSAMPDTPAPSRDPAPEPVAVSVPAPTEVTPPALESKDEPSPSPAAAIASAAETATAPANPSLVSPAPASLASQIAPVLPPIPNPAAAAAPAPSDSGSSNFAAVPTLAAEVQPSGPVKLYWSEPVTPPNGPAPEVALDQIKLVEVHGEVSVITPSGETQVGSEGMVVPSGSTIRTLDNASAALFMGAVNSARLMPRCELVVTQSLVGPVRNTLLDLHGGAVFSRVGQREGETQNYQVRTLEGVTDAASTDFLSYRGTLEDLQGTRTTLRSGLFDRGLLLAWDPVPAAPGLIRDVPESLLGEMKTSPRSAPYTYFYYCGRQVSQKAAEMRHMVYGGSKPTSPARLPAFGRPDSVLQAVLVLLQPFNYKLHDMLYRVNSGTGTPGDLAFYHNLITVFFDHQVPALLQDLETHPKDLARVLGQASGILKQDLAPFGTSALTPF